jgi:hypothetical protein
MIITPNGTEEAFGIRMEIEREFPNTTFIEDFDHCIVDVSMSGSVIYSVNKIIATLMSGEHNLCEHDAYDYFDYMIIPQYADLPILPRHSMLPRYR